MWVRCQCGRRHWGRWGAAGLLLFDRANASVLLQKRGPFTHHGGTWAVPGGALGRNEAIIAGALRETEEEIGLRADAVRTIRIIPGLDHGNWTYQYVLGEIVQPWELGSHRSWETVAVHWHPLASVSALDLHPDFRADWTRLHAELSEEGGSSGNGDYQRCPSG